VRQTLRAVRIAPDRWMRIAPTRWMRIAPALLLAAACSEAPQEPGVSPLVQEGRRVYQNVCIACHAGDPNQDGAVGPAIAGASRELLEARVLRGEYPPGYTPKRPGNAMPRFEYLAGQIEALEAFLADAAAKGAAQPSG
jgi:mono/diheme cytochrome c family protein